MVVVIVDRAVCGNEIAAVGPNDGNELVPYRGTTDVTVIRLQNLCGQLGILVELYADSKRRGEGLTL